MPSLSPSDAVDTLRDIADWLANELPPRTPHVYVGPHSRPHVDFYCSTDADDFAAFVRWGMEWGPGRKSTAGTGDTLMRVTYEHPGGWTINVFVERDAVCEAVVVGRETVQVPDPEAPLVEVTRDVIEWRCGSILAEREADIERTNDARVERAEMAGEA